MNKLNYCFFHHFHNNMEKSKSWRGELMGRKWSVLLLIAILILLTSCKSIKNNSELPFQFGISEDIEVPQDTSYIIPEGDTIETRYSTPEGFNRTEIEESSFGQFLRNQKLKPYGEKVLYYNGREKSSMGIYDSVMDVDIGDRDLHQCADAIMLLRGEYLYSISAYDEIKFNFVSGFTAEYRKWMEGYRISVEGNNVSYYKGANPSNTYEDFRKYMNMVMAYAGTLSLEKELEPVDVKDMEIGDVFIVGGSPGHAVIVVDMAMNDTNEKIFIIAQSYMPAQQTQILINPNDNSISPWYSLKDKDKLITPEWFFNLDTLRRFKDQI